MDDELTGGQAWWDTILSEIRDCDGFLFLVSEASLESQACRRELSYAQALGKSVIPVGFMVLVPELLPPDLAVLQCLDFSAQNRESVFQLAGALAGTPAAPPLPDPRPAEPPVPVSYMSELTQRVNAPTLTLDEQFAILARLRGALDHPREAEVATKLLERLGAREDLLYAVGRELTALLADRPRARPSSVDEDTRPDPEPESPPGSAGLGDLFDAFFRAEHGRRDRPPLI